VSSSRQRDDHQSGVRLEDPVAARAVHREARRVGVEVVDVVAAAVPAIAVVLTEIQPRAAVPARCVPADGPVPAGAIRAHVAADRVAGFRVEDHGGWHPVVRRRVAWAGQLRGKAQPPRPSSPGRSPRCRAESRPRGLGGVGTPDQAGHMGNLADAVRGEGRGDRRGGGAPTALATLMPAPPDSSRGTRSSSGSGRSCGDRLGIRSGSWRRGAEVGATPRRLTTSRIECGLPSIPLPPTAVNRRACRRTSDEVGFRQ
jgi:hypothetical protein